MLLCFSTVSVKCVKITCYHFAASPVRFPLLFCTRTGCLARQCLLKCLFSSWSRKSDSPLCVCKHLRKQLTACFYSTGCLKQCSVSLSATLYLFARNNDRMPRCRLHLWEGNSVPLSTKNALIVRYLPVVIYSLLFKFILSKKFVTV